MARELVVQLGGNDSCEFSEYKTRPLTGFEAGFLDKEAGINGVPVHIDTSKEQLSTRMARGIGSALFLNSGYSDVFPELGSTMTCEPTANCAECPRRESSEAFVEQLAQRGLLDEAAETVIEE